MAMPANPQPNRRSVRLDNFDYASPNGYFVTICTWRRRCLFGNIRNGIVLHSPFGKIADACWREIPRHAPYVELDQYTIMPNHIHGILFLTGANRPPSDAPRPIVAANAATPHAPAPFSLGAVVGAFKSAVTAAIRRTCGGRKVVVWQQRYHDHVIRGCNDLDTIREYVAMNPRKWDLDRENPRRPPSDEKDVLFWEPAQCAPTAGRGMPRPYVRRTSSDPRQDKDRTTI